MGLMLSSISAAEAACGAAGLLAAVQLLTPANPIGSSLRLLRQFRSQVSVLDRIRREKEKEKKTERL
jgi:hypothetical protein